MRYTGQTTTRPRSALVIVGGMLATVGLLAGVLVTTPQLHVALSIGGEPVEMTWHELAAEGIGKQTHVRLTGVAVQRNEPPSFFSKILQLDSPPQPEEAAPADKTTAAEPISTVPPEDPAVVPETTSTRVPEIDFETALAEAMGPLKVYPQGEDPDQVPDLVVIPSLGDDAELAIEEISATGMLTGRLIPRFSDGRLSDLVRLVNRDTSRDQITGADETSDPRLATSPNSGELSDVVTSSDPPPRMTAQYVYESTHHIPSVSEAEQWFWLSGLAVAVGLVVCGAGGPSLTCCLFFQGPAILSLLGYPMRYGRATKNTRIVYAVIGIALMICGGTAMIYEGGFGRLDGDVTTSALAFVPIFVGAAAVLGSGTNWLVTRLNIELEPAKQVQADEPKFSLSDACSLEPADSESLIDFADRELTPTTSPPPTELRELADSLAAAGFEPAEYFEYIDGFDTQSVLLQLGCQDLIVADVEQHEDVRRTRLVSVLHDGFTLITVSANDDTEKESRYGTHGEYHRSPVINPLEMLSVHFEQTVAMAEKRGTTVVALDPSEKVDVAEFGRRVLADIRCQYGEESVRIGPMCYGRFHFPPQPIASFEEA